MAADVWDNQEEEEKESVKIDFVPQLKRTKMEDMDTSPIICDPASDGQQMADEAPRTQELPTTSSGSMNSLSPFLQTPEAEVRQLWTWTGCPSPIQTYRTGNFPQMSWYGSSYSSTSAKGETNNSSQEGPNGFSN